MADECVDLCIELFTDQCLDQCDETVNNCLNEAYDKCIESSWKCSGAAIGCLLAPATGIGAVACALAAAECFSTFKDCVDGLVCDDDYDLCVMNCIIDKTECCLHC